MPCGDYRGSYFALHASLNTTKADACYDLVSNEEVSTVVVVVLLDGCLLLLP